MVIAGKPRGNAPQLGRYLFTEGKNENITILRLDGRRDATIEDFKDFLYSVELNSELTRSNNSTYHAYINPNPEDTIDRVMTIEEWDRSVDILTEKLKYEDQRHGVVLHDLGNGRIHAHIVYERYNHERGTMVTYEHNYAAHDKAREQMEVELDHKRTPLKNLNQPKHKAILTKLWRETDTGEQFVRKAKANGYLIAKGTDRPFRVVDENGRSFDLARQLDKVKTKEIRIRLEAVKLKEDKEAIHEMAELKKQKELKLKTKEMNWKNLVKDNSLTLSEIQAKHDGKIEMLKEIEDDPLLSNMQREKLLDKRILLAEDLENEIDEQLVSMYNSQELQIGFPQNGRDISRPDFVDSKMQNQLNQQAEDITAQKAVEREKLLKQMRDGAERNRGHTYEGRT